MNTEKQNNDTLLPIKEEVGKLEKKATDVDPGVILHQEFRAYSLFDRDGGIVACYVVYGGEAVLKFLDGRHYTGDAAKFIMGESN